jgi:hypothetical protein
MRNREEENRKAAIYRKEHPDRVKQSQKVWRESHTEERRVTRAKHYYDTRTPEELLKKRATIYLRKYGIPLEEKEQRIESQGKCCAVCGTTKAGGRYGTFHTDHDHETKKLRGELCQRCNFVLGNVKDNEALLFALQIYLKKWRTNDAEPERRGDQ